MIRLASLAAAVAALALVVPAQAAPLKIGAEAPKFSGLEGADGKSYSLADMKDKDVVVVCITCNHCPMAIKYEDRIVEFAKKHCGEGSKVGFIAINVNNHEEDKLPKMKERSKEKGFTFPYAYDPSQKIARELGASTTPEFFVFNKARKLVYTGAMDDAADASKATVNYVESAVKSALKGESAKVETTKPRGCGIMYEKK